MCAIAGILGLPISDDGVGRMLATMARRGPDGSGVYCDQSCTLLHTRLAIIDPDGGAQPMTLEWGGERFTIIYNGELYNMDEINRKLTESGHDKFSKCDTETVLRSYIQWGENCLEMLNGIFAFAVWEEKSRRLFLARDRIGVKPLFYTFHQGGFIFSSEMKTILAYPGVQAQLDREGIAQLILLGPGRLPDSGIFHGIYQMKPGFCGYYSHNQLKLREYWRLTDQEHRDSFPETVEKVRFLVLDSIRRQMVSDAPLGTFLSGGLDSSIISAVCAEEMGKIGEKLDTFSVDYVDNHLHFRQNRFQPDEDSQYIRIMREHLGSVHQDTVLTVPELLDAQKAATRARDLPGMADVDTSMLLLCRDVRRKVKVALSGECADEIFGGYPWYRDPLIREKAGFPWAQNTGLRGDLLLPGIVKDANAFVMDAYTDSCRNSDILPGTPPEEIRMKQMVNLNFGWFMQTLLERKDRMSMYQSLEVRVPFCDYRIAQYLYSVPWAYKDHRGKEKGLLRKAMEGILPEDVLYRKKCPYPKTMDPRYAQEARRDMEALLSQKDAPLFHIISRDKVNMLLSRESPWPWYGQLMRTPQAMVYLQQVNFWLECYNVNIFT